MNTLRRTAAALAAVAVVGGLGTGVANAGTPGSSGTAEAGLVGDFHSQLIIPECDFGPAFDWGWYQFCDDTFFHGRYRNEFNDFSFRNPGFRFDRFHR